jgi:fucose permease
MKSSFRRRKMKDIREYTLTKYACYLGSGDMAIVSVLSPLLFVTFHELYGISYTLLGLLVVANFLTQLLIDLAFSFFPKWFDIHKTVRMMPVITFMGILIYAVMPWIFPKYVYLWLIIGTIVFSASAGLGEVLISPVIAAIPWEKPDREMSKLHSAYAWGCVSVVVISTLFLKFAGTYNWQVLAILLSILPLADAFMFAKAKLPEMNMNHDDEKCDTGFKNKGIIMCFVCIFLGGATELTMQEWISNFIETGIGLPKVAGDILGVAMFAVMIGIGRTAYAKIGKNISLIMLLGAAGSAVCYIVASLSLNPVVGLIACAFTGLCASMLWPGILIYAEENYPKLGVAVYALMAAGGDMGSAVVPQIVGILSDKVAVMSFAETVAQKFCITAEQVGIRTGMLSASVFPLLGVVMLLVMRRFFKSQSKTKHI